MTGKVNIGFYGESRVGPEEFEATAAGAIGRLQRDLDEARIWAKEFRRIAEAIWTDDYDTQEIDNLFEGTPTMPEWLRR